LRLWRGFAGIRTYNEGKRGIAALQDDLREFESFMQSFQEHVGTLTKGNILSDAVQTGGSGDVNISTHAWSHADGGNDPVTPYDFTWLGRHIWTPNTDRTPVTIKRTDSTTSVDLFDVTDDNVTYPFLSVNINGLVGINDSPDAHLTVRARETSPADFSNIIAWYKADSIVGGVDGVRYLGQWDDSTGNGHDLTPTVPAAAPIYKATDADGSMPALYFDSISSVMVMASSISISASAAYTIVLFYGSTGISTAYYIGTKTGSCGAFVGKDRAFAASL